MYRPDFYRAFEPTLQGGWLHLPPVKNNPLWLRVPLPQDVSISFDVKTEKADGDIKFEAFGDGRDHESGYVFIFGGWHDTISIISRGDEHGADRKERRDKRVVPGRVYHMRVTRRSPPRAATSSGTSTARRFMEYDDKHPLVGRRHDRFGFCAWETPLDFSHLRDRGAGPEVHLVTTSAWALPGKRSRTHPAAKPEARRAEHGGVGGEAPVAAGHVDHVPRPGERRGQAPPEAAPGRIGDHQGVARDGAWRWRIPGWPAALRTPASKPGPGSSTAVTEPKRPASGRVRVPMPAPSSSTGPAAPAVASRTVRTSRRTPVRSAWAKAPGWCHSPASRTQGAPRRGRPATLAVRGSKRTS